jgi:acetyl esterase/lipase
VVEVWWVTTGDTRSSAQDGGEEGEDDEPDLVLVYLHGRRFTLGSLVVYFHFLALLASSLRSHGFQYPVIFAPEYGLAPETRLPGQMERVKKTWMYALTKTKTRGGTANIGLGGDSAGELLALSLLLSMEAGSRRPDFVT